MVQEREAPVGTFSLQDIDRLVELPAANDQRAAVRVSRRHPGRIQASNVDTLTADVDPLLPPGHGLGPPEPAPVEAQISRVPPDRNFTVARVAEHLGHLVLILIFDQPVLHHPGDGPDRPAVDIMVPWNKQQAVAGQRPARVCAQGRPQFSFEPNAGQLVLVRLARKGQIACKHDEVGRQTGRSIARDKARQVVQHGVRVPRPPGAEMDIRKVKDADWESCCPFIHRRIRLHRRWRWAERNQKAPGAATASACSGKLPVPGAADTFDCLRVPPSNRLELRRGDLVPERGGTEATAPAPAGKTSHGGAGAALSLRGCATGEPDRSCLETGSWNTRPQSTRFGCSGSLRAISGQRLLCRAFASTCGERPRVR